MAAACIPIPFRTEKHSVHILAVSTVLALTCPMDMSIQGSSRVDSTEYCFALTMIHTLKNFPIHGTNSVLVTYHWGRGVSHLTWITHLAFTFIWSTHFPTPYCSLQPSLFIFYITTTDCTSETSVTTTNVIINHPCVYILFPGNKEIFFMHTDTVI